MLNNICMLETNKLNIGYKTKKKETCIHSNLNLYVVKGEFVCLIGPNGAGKSTLIRTLCGLQEPLSGKTIVNNKIIEKSSNNEIAKLISVVLTDKPNISGMTVFNVVALGRFPYTSWLGNLSNEDNKIILDSLDLVGMKNFANKQINQLSDGERQRVMIAKALSQDTPLIILDEPTAHLDLPNRVEVLQLLRTLTHKTKKSVILSTHELDLALQAADTIWLMPKSDEIIIGSPEDLVLDGSLENIFHNKSIEFDKLAGNFRIQFNKTKDIKLIGKGINKYWTERALLRKGFNINNDCPVIVEIIDNYWSLKKDNKTICCKSITELLYNLGTL